jgi:hypothetical protein
MCDSHWAVDDSLVGTRLIADIGHRLAVAALGDSATVELTLPFLPSSISFRRANHNSRQRDIRHHVRPTVRHTAFDAATGAG